MQADHRYIVLHTHPRSTSFSPDDIVVLADNPSLKIMIAVGVDTTWYILSKRDEARPIDPFRIAGEARRERLSLEAEGVPFGLRSHLATERVAARHSLR